MHWKDESSILAHARSLPPTAATQLLLIGGLILALLTLSACQQENPPPVSHGSTPSPISTATQPSQEIASLCSKPENGDGIIVKIDKVSTTGNAGGNGALVLLSLDDPTQKTSATGLGRVNLIVTVLASTHIFWQHGTNCQTLQAASLPDLKVGQKLKVWSQSGIVLTSYPGQIRDTSAIVIVL
jgi:hypothetical protein